MTIPSQLLTTPHMGFHHVYDNANVSECLWMLGEIEDYMFWLLEHARERQRANNERRRRRHMKQSVEDENVENKEEDEVSDDTDVGSNADYLSVHESDIDSELDEEEFDKAFEQLVEERAERVNHDPIDTNHKSYANG